MRKIEIIDRKVIVDGQKLFLELVSMDEKEGMLVHQAAEAFGIKEATIWNHLSNHKLRSLTLSRTKLKELRNHGVIGSKVNRATFLDKSTIRSLAKIIETQTAWDIYNQLWNVTDKAYEMHQEQKKPTQLDVLDLMVKQLGTHDNAIKSVSSRIEDLESSTPQIIEKQIDNILHQKGSFPEDCIHSDLIGPRHFPGVSQTKVIAYLKSIKHPRGDHLHTNDQGTFPSYPFKKKGLEEVAKTFFAERTFVRETDKTKIWFHPEVGVMHERKTEKVG